MSFLENLILGIIGSELIDDVERLHDQRTLEREQHRHDSLFWQDAARRGEPYDDIDDIDDLI